jgi:hypothetical protein
MHDLPSSPLFFASLLAVLVLTGIAPPEAAAIQVGDDEATVRSELGPPVGQYKLGGRTIMSFERGEVEFIDGSVTRSELISAEAAAQRTARREREAAEAAERARIAKERRLAEGQAIYERKVGDASFLTAPAAEQVAFWNGFKRKYPEIPLGPESGYQQAVNENNLEIQAQRQAAAQAAAAQASTQLDRSSTSTRAYYNRDYYLGGGGIIVAPNDPVHLPVVRASGPHVTPVESTAGYGFQRAKTQPPPTARPPVVQPRPRPTPRPSMRR